MKKFSDNISNIMKVALLTCIISYIFAILTKLTGDTLFLKLMLIMLFITTLFLEMYKYHKKSFNLYEINYGFFWKKAWINQKSSRQIAKLHNSNYCIMSLMNDDKKKILALIKESNCEFYSVTFPHMIEKISALGEDFNIEITDIHCDGKKKYEKYVKNMYTSKCANCNKKAACNKARTKANTKMFAIKLNRIEKTDIE